MTRTPPRRLKPAAIASVLGTILFAVYSLACAPDQASSPDQARAASHLLQPPKAGFTSLDDASRTLAVSINGPNRVTSETSVTYRRIVSGGSGNYQYDWLREYCYGDGGTPYCSSLELLQSGPDTSFTIFYPAEIGKMRIVLHVWDDQQQPYSGSASRITLGIFPPGYTNPDYTCDYGQGYYPIADYVPGFPDSTTYYRRNGCTGAREYAPTAP